MLKRAINLVYTYLSKNCTSKKLNNICNALKGLQNCDSFDFELITDSKEESYDKLQEVLSKINEKEHIRKKNGVYYTPIDLVEFIVKSTFKSMFGKLTETNVHDLAISTLPYKTMCMRKRVLDPTCGTGEFLLASLEMKYKIWSAHSAITEKDALEILTTIYGNDVNRESVIITQIRLLLCVLKWCPTVSVESVKDILLKNFTVFDFVSHDGRITGTYHVIIGNPPYVEDSKCGLTLQSKYGNIYANVLIHSSNLLEKNGAMGFVIPLSYISTPRMNRLRTDLFETLPEQFILSYADRPDCLFDSVHQKLCVLIAKNRNSSKKVFTSKYQYWYKEERNQLFSNVQVIKNNINVNKIIPKLGNQIDVEIFSKIVDSNRNVSVYEVSRSGTEAVYLNRRETFWMKAYRTFVDDPEYKVFKFHSKQEADYCYCLINSSLFWWYWIAVSDCWHVSKDLNGFMAPFLFDHKKASELAHSLQNKLEETKVYVGTRQTEYEYKHKNCLNVIYEIDEFVNEIFGLTKEQSDYIKEYALKYRTGGGVNDGCY